MVNDYNILNETLESGQQNNPVFNVTDKELKKIYLNKSLLSYILKIKTFPTNERTTKESYSAPSTAKEQALIKEIERLNQVQMARNKELIFYKELAQKNNNQSVNNIVTEVKKYNETERETHLQAIAFLSIKLSERIGAFKTGEGKIKLNPIAMMLEKMSKENCITAKSQDTFNRRLAEAVKLFQKYSEDSQ